MSKVSMMGTITCQDGKADEMEAVLTTMVEAAHDEPGVEIYSYHRGEGNNFSFFALLSDAESMQSHGQSDGHEGGNGCLHAADGGAAADVAGHPHRRHRLRDLRPSYSHAIRAEQRRNGGGAEHDRAPQQPLAVRRPCSSHGAVASGVRPEPVAGSTSWPAPSLPRS